MGSYQSSLGWGLILAAAAGLGAASARSARPDTGHLTPVTFSSPDTLRSRALHVLNRLTYGPRPGDVDRVMAMGIDRFIEAQLDPDGTNDDALEERYPQLVVLARSPLELAEMVAEAQRQRMARRRAMRDSVRPVPRSPIPESPLRRITGAFQQAAILRAAVSERQLYEIMVDFWFNHFNVHFGKGAVRFTGPPYLERTIRPRALGRFEDLLIATAQSPAMLFYLDNVQSVAPGSEPPEMQRQRTAGRQGRQPAQPRMDSLRQRLQRRMPRGLNENYARELLELHTLGVGGGYTQDDVINVARILTGWSMDRATFASAFVFNDWAHDRGEKRVLGRTFPAGQGMAEGIELLKILASHPATMRHVGAKLCARFVNDEPPAGCVDAAVRGWQRSGGEIREVLRAILQSPEFWAPENRGAKIKTPLEFLVSAIRAVGARPDTTIGMARLLAGMGQPLFLQEAPTGYPETQESWVNSGALLQRVNLAMAIAAGRAPGITFDLDAVLPAGGDPDALVDAVNRIVLNGTGSAATLKVIGDRVAGSGERDARALAVGLALGSPEFQKQ